MNEAEGIALTVAIMAAVAPVVDQQPSDLVVQAMAAVMLATTTTAVASPTEQATVLRRLSERLSRVADDIESREHAIARGTEYETMAKPPAG